MTFKTLRVLRENAPAEMCEVDLTPLSTDEVLIHTEYSGVNYKDAMAVTATGKILKNFPLTPGIDVAGEIVESTSSQFKKGDKVLINGSGLGENIDGGFSEYVRAPDSIVVPLPEGLSTREAMILGTAGFTAALCVKRMEVNGQKPEMGPILVTGASGGVGSIAVQILARRGYEVVAVSGKSTAVDLLKSYGAQQVLSPSNLNLGQRPLESARWAGAIDNVGGELLAGIIRHIQLWGNVASVGLADSAQLHTTVMPFILRGVSLLGASSANCPIHLKQEIWQDLGANWKPLHLDNMINSELHLEDIREYSEQLLARQKMGRALVKL